MLEQILGKLKKKMTPEEAFKRAIDASIEERREMVINHADDIKKLFDINDISPIITSDKKRIKSGLEGRLNKINYLVKEGEKLGGRSLTNSYQTTVAEIRRSTSEILEELKERNLKISDLEKSVCYIPFEKKEMWAEEDVKNLDFDWMVGAVINYYKNRLDGKELKSADELSKEEFLECLDLIKSKKEQK